MLSDFTSLQAKVLALIAWADGRFDDRERTLYREVLEASPGTDALRIELFRLTETPPDRGEVLAALGAVPGELAATVIKNAYLLAHADGQLHNEERSLLDAFAVASHILEADLPKFHEMLERFRAAHLLERQLFKV